MTRRTYIGLDRRIALSWLDSAASLAAAGEPITTVRVQLWRLLEGEVSGEKINSSRGKTVTILNHVWGSVPERALRLRSHAAAFFNDATPPERLALHWAMLLATYPVFSDAAEVMGRLLSLQDSLAIAHVKRRLAERWGDRTTLDRSLQRITRSMLDWGVLRETEPTGSYAASGVGRPIGNECTLVLMEALLVSSEADSIALDALIRHPALFPFAVSVDANALREAGPFRIDREGLTVDAVSLRYHE
jgi:hypothetical protein